MRIKGRVIKRIDELDLNIRVVNVLHKHNIETIDKLMKMSKDKIYNLSGLGFKGVWLLEVALREVNITPHFSADEREEIRFALKLQR
jgi:DNA-directed RNA polymerase alpha subunit